MAGDSAADEEGTDDAVILLQSRSILQPNEAAVVATATAAAAAARGTRDLALIHIPFNFGHTVENVAMFGAGTHNQRQANAYMQTDNMYSGHLDAHVPTWREAAEAMIPGGEVWGHLNPDLNVVSEVTGRPMYYTPQKHWPRALAEKYLGGKIPFGLLRDPYERLVALFRGNLSGYGGAYPEYIKTCDVNSAVKLMMKRLLEGGDPYAAGCTFAPQAEYFEGPYGIQLPVNLRQFPASMNRVFSKHGYPESFQITIPDVQHVTLCSQVWAGDLDEETKSMVRKYYRRDFELLCEHFGYCDPDENCCIWQVPMMCPDKVLALGYHGVALNVSGGVR